MTSSWRSGQWSLSRARASSHSRRDRSRSSQGDWKPLGLSVPDRLGDVPVNQMATLEIQPEALLIKNGFPLPRAGSSLVTQDDFRGVIAAIERAANVELGSGSGLACSKTQRKIALPRVTSSSVRPRPLASCPERNQKATTRGPVLSAVPERPPGRIESAGRVLYPHWSSRSSRRARGSCAG